MSFRERYTGLIERYRECLPLPANVRPISLGEGNTPLIQLLNIPKALGLDVEWYAKYEGLNPTGSFKDRGMTMAVTEAVAEGSQAIICASTGNTSAAAAAYAARAGISAIVLIPDGKIAMGKLAQAMMHGALVIQIQGNFDEGLRLVRDVAEELPLAIVNSINPYRLQGQKTIAFEILEELGRAPDYHCLPVGNAGNITAHWIGYTEHSTVADITGSNIYTGPHSYIQKSFVDGRPIMVGYQASGAAPFLRGGPVAEPETIATAIRIGDPQSWDYAWAASKESGGWFDELSDEEILAAQKMLAEKEGIFCEPASAASVAGAIRDLKSGKIPAGKTIVSTLTGHGLKDPDVAIKQSGSNVVSVKAALKDVKEMIAKNL